MGCPNCLNLNVNRLTIYFTDIFLKSNVIYVRDAYLCSTELAFKINSNSIEDYMKKLSGNPLKHDLKGIIIMTNACNQMRDLKLQMTYQKYFGYHILVCKSFNLPENSFH